MAAKRERETLMKISGQEDERIAVPRTGWPYLILYGIVIIVNEMR